MQSILHGELCQPDDRVMILAPIVRGRKGAYRKELEKFAQDGYVRVRINGELFPLDELPVIDKRKNHTIEIVIDRLLVKPGIAARLEQSISTALKLASGLVTVVVVGGKEHVFSEKLACPDCGISVPQFEPRSFSFNSPYGACPACNGLGSKYDFDPAKMIVDWSRPLFEGGLGPGSASAPLKHTHGAGRVRAWILAGHGVRKVSAAYSKHVCSTDIRPPTTASPKKKPLPTARKPAAKRVFTSRASLNSSTTILKNRAPTPTASG